MNIAILSPLWKRVPPLNYGGTELVVSNLAKGLTRLGHATTTFACGGSKVAGELVEVIPDEMHNLANGFKWDAIQSYEFLTFNLLGARINDFDIIHNHMGIHPAALSSFCPIPFLTTLHSSLPPDFPLLADSFANHFFSSVSKSQQHLAPNLNYVASVHHGIDTDSFEPSLEKGSYLFFIGSLSYDKGVDIAVRAAAKLNKPLILAGEIRESEKMFLEREVFPMVDGYKIRYIGEVNHREKNALYAGAEALLFPSRWEEAFGLVMIESLACGTPVVAMNSGSPCEVIRHGRTGYVVQNEAEFIDAITKVGKISRKECCDEAVSRFSVIEMASRYIEVYKKLIALKA